MQSSNELMRIAGELADGDDPDKAVEICNKVLVDEPDHPGALFVLGCVLLKAARHVPAMQMGKRITDVCPKDPRGWQLLALVYGELHKYDESIRCAERALACKRTDKVLADVAYAHVNGGNWDLADKYSKEAIAEAQRNPSPLASVALQDATLSQSYTRLAKGDWVPGWAGYRVTLMTKWRKLWTYGDSVEWQGEPDAVVMVTGEQGLGDEIMAASMIPDAAKACKRFILDCDHRLAALFARSFPNVIVSPTRRTQEVRLPVMPTHHKALFGLAELLRKKDEDFHRQPYLVPNQDYVGMFRELFHGQRVIGLAWSGGLPRTGQEPRTAGLNAFLPLVRMGGAEFVSLQYKDDAAEVAEFEKAHGVKVRRLPWVTQGPDQDLLAGLLAACTEVVGVHTSALHLAAAVGVPTTILTHRGSGWRYARELLWYPPTTQMFRKRSGESWRECVARLVESRKVKLAA
jgi:tetratricopeptide (TPR) repeat protein